ncbi:rab-GTPase-TBC domain-containing protein [Dendryphion nanum]|uniref:Rab-GTPase-TBC domain-containing protein n=1 Tax=Dendryphion nanum TaxID=256645 RepID=A0A9P9IRQ2_9PLEO|nr:rab-GTPase-TBC domain-containing protein [Dendryphion nanum]
MASRTPSRSLRSSSSASLPSTVDRSDDLSASHNQHKEKTELIKKACDAHDLEALIDLATGPHGLVADSLRRLAWPILLGCTEHETKTVPWSSLPPHREEEQVAKDVNRAFVHYPNESDRQLETRKQELSDVIIEVLRRHPSLCYFQGYHDIVQVLYLALGSQAAPAAATRLSLLRIRDFMLPTLDPAISHLELLPPIINAVDPQLYAHLPRIQPNYALGATLTLFSHVIEAYGDITRLFDFFLANDTVIPIYFFAAILLSRRDELLELEEDEDEAIVYVMLGRLPQPFDVELRIAQTLELYRKAPPNTLQGWAWWKVSSSSVLKATSTTFDVARLSLERGEALFHKQETEVQIRQAYQKSRRAARRIKLHAWRYRRPGSIGLAIAVGMYAIWNKHYNF